MRDWVTTEADRSFDAIVEEVAPLFGDDSSMRHVFSGRLEAEWERIFRLSHQLYGWRWDFSWKLIELVRVTACAAVERRKWLRRRDALDAGAGWLADPSSVWAMGYLDRFTGGVEGLDRAVPYLRELGVTHLHLMPPYAVPENGDDGGYAVTSYRRLRPDLGTIDQLADACRSLHKEGVGVVLDFVANHTADDHMWAEAAKRGEAPYDRFYFMFDDRPEVDAWLPHLREIFPDRGGDAFTWRADVRGTHGGKWVWTTFYPFQWDLNYREPEVLVAMTAELLSIVNLGVAAVRMDATPFLWKQSGTSCENLPEAHLILQLFNAVTAVAAPSVRFLSEAIVHPDEVERFIHPDECALGYNPMLMSATWEALATRNTLMLADTLARRSALPGGCQWVSYLRSHDDIGWGFADEDARAHGIDAQAHRRFLNEFYSGEFPGSFAAGERFQNNPRTGDARISGTMASLAGLERALASADPVQVALAVDRIIAIETVVFTSTGIPMLFLGDEIATCNDHRYLDDRLHADDNRWMHRPRFDWRIAESVRNDPTTPSGRVWHAIHRLIALRPRIPGLGKSPPTVVPSGDPGVIAFRHRAGNRQALVVVNLSEHRPVLALADDEVAWLDAFSGEPLDLHRTLAPYEAIVALSRDEDVPGVID